jgi:hypothetical protein
MAGFKNIKPMYLYLMSIGSFLLSRFFENKVDFLNYAFAATGLVFFILANIKYFKKAR